MPLNEAQLEQYRRDGYALGSPLLSGEALARLREEMAKAIAALPPGRRPENMPSIHYENAYFRDLLLSKPFVDVAEQILGPNVALFTVYAISKQPGDGLPVDWHQDAAFFPIEPMETFTLWLAVDDADRENGCMQVLPGSQRARKVYEHKVDQEKGTTLPLSLEGIDLSSAVHVEVPAGSYSVHDAFILHGSNPNTSNRRRCGITIKYIPTHVRIDRSYKAATGFDWNNVRLYHARGDKGPHNTYANG